MMDLTHPLDPAFPCRPEELFQKVGRIVNAGLTKREYFAAMAMQGQLSSMSNGEVVKVLMADVPDPWAWSAMSALRYADALIAELNKEGTP